MAKITRFAGEVRAFASEAQAGERTIYNSSQESDDLNTNLNASYKRGFGNYGPNDVPTRQDFNAMGFTVSQTAAYLYQMGLAEYSAGQVYYTDGFTNFGGKIFVSNVDDNVGIDPVTNRQAFFDPKAGGISDTLSFNSKIVRSGSLVATYLDENLSNLVSIKYDTIGEQWNEIGRQSLVSLGITITGEYDIQQLQDDHIAIASATEFYILLVNDTTGAVTLEYSDPNFTAISGSNPVTLSSAADNGTELAYCILANNQIHLYEYTIGSQSPALLFSVPNPNSVDNFSKMVYLFGNNGGPGNEFSTFAYLSKTGKKLYTFTILYDIQTLAPDDVTDVVLSDSLVQLSINTGGDFSSNLVVLGTDPVTGESALQTYLTGVGSGIEKIQISGSQTNLGFNGVTSLVPVLGEFVSVCATNNNEILNYEKDSTQTNNWSLYSSSGIGFDNTGTGLTSTNVEDAIKEVLDLAYPIGFIWQSSFAEDPAIILGFGTWQQIEGKFLVGRDQANPLFASTGTEGGNEVSTIPRDGWGSATFGSNPTTLGRMITGSGAAEVTETLQSVGEAQNDQDIDTLPPYLVVGMWVRTA